MTARRIGLALGSGGARGWCHIGVIRALSDLGLKADVVAGSSMGALVGAAAAAGRLDALENWARAQTARSFLRLLDIRLTGGGLVGGSEIVTVIRDLGLPARIEDLPVPFVAVAADLRTGQEVWLREGDLADAVRASVALPGVIAPYQVEGRWLIDGGVVNPVPVSAARALGAGMVIAVDPNARSGGTFWEPEQSDTDTGWTALLPDIPEALRVLWPGSDAGDRPPAYVDLVSSTVDIMTDRIRRARLAGDAPDVFLPMRLSHLSVLEFHRAAEAIEAGARVTRAQADWIAACAGRAEPSA